MDVSIGRDPDWLDIPLSPHLTFAQCETIPAKRKRLRESPVARGSFIMYCRNCPNPPYSSVYAITSSLFLRIQTFNIAKDPSTGLRHDACGGNLTRATFASAHISLNSAFQLIVASSTTRIERGPWLRLHNGRTWFLTNSLRIAAVMLP